MILNDRKVPDAYQMMRFRDFEIRVIEATRYDAVGEPEYDYTVTMTRRSIIARRYDVVLTVGYFASAIYDIDYEYRAVSISDKREQPLIFVDPDEARFAAMAAIRRFGKKKGEVLWS